MKTLLLHLSLLMFKSYLLEKPLFHKLPSEITKFWGNQKVLDPVMVITSLSPKME